MTKKIKSKTIDKDPDAPPMELIGVECHTPQPTNVSQPGRMRPRVYSHTITEGLNAGAVEVGYLHANGSREEVALVRRPCESAGLGLDETATWLARMLHLAPLDYESKPPEVFATLEYDKVLEERDIADIAKVDERIAASLKHAFTMARASHAKGRFPMVLLDTTMFVPAFGAWDDQAGLARLILGQWTEHEGLQIEVLPCIDAPGLSVAFLSKEQTHHEMLNPIASFLVGSRVRGAAVLILRTSAGIAKGIVPPQASRKPNEVEVVKTVAKIDDTTKSAVVADPVDTKAS